MVGWTARALYYPDREPAATVASWISSGLTTLKQLGRGKGDYVIRAPGLIELVSALGLRKDSFFGQAIRQVIHNLRELYSQEQPIVIFILVVIGKDIVRQDSQAFCASTNSPLKQIGQHHVIFAVGEQYNEILHQLQNESVFVSQPPEKEISYVA
jgi:hypothetical protein